MTDAPKKPTGIDRYVGPVSIAQAIEAFTKWSGLTPTAKLLGIELVSRFNPRTMKCFPSEQYLAIALGVSTRMIRKAKDELKDQGLINWRRGHRGRCCEYVISWRRLKGFLKQFKTERRLRTDSDRDELIALHNEIQSGIGGTVVPIVDEKAELLCHNGGTVVPNDRNCSSALLSHENTHERVSAAIDAQPVAERTGQDGQEHGVSRRPAHDVTEASLNAARQALVTYLSPKIRKQLGNELFEAAVRVCADGGTAKAGQFIRLQRRHLRKDR